MKSCVGTRENRRLPMGTGLRVETVRVILSSKSPPPRGEVGIEAVGLRPGPADAGAAIMPTDTTIPRCRTRLIKSSYPAAFDGPEADPVSDGFPPAFSRSVPG
jgi:hypothetical protein